MKYLIALVVVIGLVILYVHMSTSKSGNAPANTASNNNTNVVHGVTTTNDYVSQWPSLATNVVIAATAGSQQLSAAPKFGASIPLTTSN